MSENYKLMCVLAHPDDESLGTGGTLAKYASQGVEIYLVTATRGERGRFGDAVEKPPPEEIGRIRETELRNAARVLGVKSVHFLDYMDGDLDTANPDEAISRIAGYFCRYKPQIVITFGPEGGYGHPDHIAISQFTTAAVVRAADSRSSGDSHTVSKLYYMAWSDAKWEAYQAAFRNLKSTVDGIDRMVAPWPEWAITSFIDTRQHWKTTWEAVKCHKTQLTIYSQLENLPEKHHQAIWGTQEYYRVFSLVNGSRHRENDLFEGLRL